MDDSINCLPTSAGPSLRELTEYKLYNRKIDIHDIDLY